MANSTSGGLLENIKTNFHHIKPSFSIQTPRMFISWEQTATRIPTFFMTWRRLKSWHQCQARRLSSLTSISMASSTLSADMMPMINASSDLANITMSRKMNGTTLNSSLPDQAHRRQSLLNMSFTKKDLKLQHVCLTMTPFLSLVDTTENRERLTSSSGSTSNRKQWS